MLCQYWADRFGVTPNAFEGTGITVGSSTEGAVQLFHTNKAVVVGAPRSLMDLCEQYSAALATIDTETCDDLREWVRDIETVDRVIGPVFYGYTDVETFDPINSEARILTRSDETAFGTFRKEIPDVEWEHGGPEFIPERTIGVFANGSLVAIAGYEIWDDLIAHIAVVTHPDHRNEGYGRKVVSRVTDQALIEGFVPQYRTLDAWASSVALARGLGFERFSTAYIGIQKK